MRGDFMLVYRICHERYAAEPFTGEGARLVGGRWNSPGRRAVYTASSRSLAALEMLVHHTSGVMPAYVVAPATIPEDVPRTTVAVASLPPRWRDHDGACRPVGDAWLRARETSVLVVPSAVVPEESNVVLNPDHPDFGRIALGTARPFVLDGRLFG